MMFFFSSRRRHTRLTCDWSSDVCSSDLASIGVDFASGVRTLLRQDPDIIMVGEVRDRDTGEMAVQAALTGHLVLRSEERRVGKECRSRWSLGHNKTKHAMLGVITVRRRH